MDRLVQQAIGKIQNKAQQIFKPVQQFQPPQIQMPQFRAPQIQVPQFRTPQVQVPQFKAPNFKPIISQVKPFLQQRGQANVQAQQQRNKNFNRDFKDLSAGFMTSPDAPLDPRYGSGGTAYGLGAFLGVGIPGAAAGVKTTTKIAKPFVGSVRQAAKELEQVAYRTKDIQELFNVVRSNKKLLKTANNMFSDAKNPINTYADLFRAAKSSSMIPEVPKTTGQLFQKNLKESGLPSTGDQLVRKPEGGYIHLVKTKFKKAKTAVEERGIIGPDSQKGFARLDLGLTGGKTEGLQSKVRQGESSKGIISQGAEAGIYDTAAADVGIKPIKNLKVAAKQISEEITQSRQTQQPIQLSGQAAQELQQGVKLKQPIVPDFPSSSSMIPQGNKQRKFVTSVKESPNVTKPTQLKVKGNYTPKPNKQLMGEAKALLNENASLDIKHVKNIDQKVAATIQEAINLDEAGKHNEAAALYNNLSAQGTELGRGVQAFSLLNKMSPEAIALSAAGKIKRYNQNAIRKIPELTGTQQKEISTMVEKIRKIPVGKERNIAVAKMHDKINEFIPSSIADKAVTIWKAGLLTSLRTQERNILGNTIHGIAEIAKDLPASVADRLLSAKTGKRTLTLTARGFGSGGRKGVVAGKDYLRHGVDVENSIAKYDVKKITWGKNKVEQSLKIYTEAVFRTLGATDKPFYHAAFGRSMYDQAGAAAINAKKGGNSKFIKNLVDNPTTEMLTQATKDAETATFKNRNVISESAGALKNKMGPVGDVIAPFTGVPSSIAGQIVAYSPIGLVKGAFSAGRVLAQDVPGLQRQASQEIGRGVMGSALFGIGAYLASKGLMTGQPKDAEEARQWQLENKQANSVLISGQWRAIGSIGPENLVMLAGGKAQQELGQGGGGVGAMAFGTVKDFTDQTMLKGVQGPLNAISDPGRYGKHYFQGQAASVIPNIVKDAAKSQDLTSRQTNSVKEAMQAGIPFKRNELLPKQDALGNDIPQSPTGVKAFIDLFNSRKPNTQSNTINELARLNNAGFNAVPSKLKKEQTIGGEKMTLTPKQLNNLNAVGGSQITGDLAELFNTPEYKALSDGDKQEAVDDMISKTRKIVRANIDINSGVLPYGDRSSTKSSITPTSNKTGTYTLISPSGTVKKIDLNKAIDYPKLTGNPQLDKKLVSDYNSELTTRSNDIVALFKAGKIDANTAESLLGKVAKGKMLKGKKGKKLKAIKPPKFKNIKSKTVKLKKIKSLRFKVQKPKLYAKK